jgi:hypothetical protein
MKPPDEFSSKGRAVEEWVDLHFFRPAGYAIARRLLPSAVTPDRVTIASLLVGLLAGHLFLYHNAWINAAGLVLFLLSDVFDSADGQLARMRGSSSRLGRILDGVSDNLRFINLYLTLFARLLLAGMGWEAVFLIIAAGLSHSLQSTAADFMRQAYLTLGGGGNSELDLPENLPTPSGSFFNRVLGRFYRGYVSRQARLFPRTIELARFAARHEDPTALTADYRRLQRRLVTHCAWIAQNIRFALLLLIVLTGSPISMLWVTIIPLNAIAVLLMATHEHHAGQLLGTLPEVMEPHVRIA